MLGAEVLADVNVEVDVVAPDAAAGFGDDGDERARPWGMLGTDEPRRRAVGRAEGVIEEVLADAGEVGAHRDAQLAQVVAGTDAGAEEDGR